MMGVEDARGIAYKIKPYRKFQNQTLDTTLKETVTWDTRDLR